MENNNYTRNNEAASEEKVYYSIRMIRRAKNAPLEDAVMTVSGTIVSANVINTQNGERLAIRLESVLGDKFVESTFGKEFVAPDHKVIFNFLLGGYDMDSFIKHPPRWGQYIVVQLHNMRPRAFSRKNGETGRDVSCYCSGIGVLGSTKKADGSERTPVKIFGVADSSNASAAPEASGGMFTDMDDMSLLDDDEELPF